jgi:hypothetical protein
MKKIVIKFRDEELGDELVTFKYNEKKYDYVSTMNLAKEILYLDFDCASYKELKEERPELTRRLYNKAMEVLENGDCGVTTERFCEFMKVAFGWKYEVARADEVFNVYYGYWDVE